MTECIKFTHSVDGVKVSRFGPLGFTCTFNVISEVTCRKDSERSVRKFWNELTPKDASNFLSLVSDEIFDDLGLKSSSQWPLGKAEFERSLGILLTSRVNEYVQKMGFRKLSGDGNSFDVHVVVKEMGSAPQIVVKERGSAPPKKVVGTPDGLKRKEDEDNVYKWATLNAFIALSVVVFKYAMPQVGADATWWFFAALIQYILMGFLFVIPLGIWLAIELLIANSLRNVPFVGRWLFFLPSALVSLLLLFVMIGPELSFSSTGGKTCLEVYAPNPNPNESQVQRFLECVARNR